MQAQDWQHWEALTIRWVSLDMKTVQCAKHRIRQAGPVSAALPEAPTWPDSCSAAVAISGVRSSTKAYRPSLCMDTLTTASRFATICERRINELFQLSKGSNSAVQTLWPGALCSTRGMTKRCCGTRHAAQGIKQVA